MKAYYDAHREVYTTPQTRVVSHILVKNKALADKLEAQLKGGADFAALAKKYSHRPGLEGAGRTADDHPRPDRARSSTGPPSTLRTGQLSKPVQDPVRLAHHPRREGGDAAASRRRSRR